MDLIDTKYISLISSSLGKFKKVKSDLYNFRCPICGDSKKNKNKTRGYFYSIKNNTNFKCHNCGSSLSFNNFLKKINPSIHKQYTLEKFKEGYVGKGFVVEEPKLEFKKPVFRKKLNLPQASSNFVANEYLTRRKLNPKSFYYAEKFKEWVNTQKYTFSNIVNDEPRIVIPLYDEDKNLIGFQGRALGKSNAKYITVMLFDHAPKVYGLDTINKKLPIYVVEGPFDSTFIPNSIALCGSDGDVSFLKEFDIIFVYDNEPRNKEIVNKIENVINSGHKLVVWPSSIKEKDINDMVLAGLDIENVIKSNIYCGLEAKLKFTNWKKI